MVVSDTRNAEAISGTVSPPSRRRVSATRASGARAGWQQVKISRSRSSSTGPVGAWGVSSAIMGPAGTWRRGATRGGSCRCPCGRRWWSATRRGWEVRRRRATARRRRAAPPRRRPRRRRCRRTGGSGRRRRGRAPRGRSARSRDRSVTSGWKGRTSTRPSHAADASIASFSAASRSGASRTQKPPIHSFASAYGPSVMIGSGPVASTVVVVSIGSRPPPNTQMPASVTFWLKASTWREHALHVVAGGHLLAHLVVHAEHVLRHGRSPSSKVGSTPPRTAARGSDNSPMTTFYRTGQVLGARVSAREQAGSSPGHP